MKAKDWLIDGRNVQELIDDYVAIYRMDRNAIEYLACQRWIKERGIHEPLEFSPPKEQP